MRKITYITGTRADYGLMKPVLREIESSKELDLEVIATGMHLMPEFGKTIDLIKKDDFNLHEIDVVYKKDNKASMARFIGSLILRLTEKVKEITPDILLLLGDRGEMLAGAIVGSYLTIPVAHIHGGDVSSTVDEHARHAITKLSHLHFPATEKSAERIMKMGEPKKRVHIVGSPALDAISKENLMPPKKVAEKYSLDLSRPLILMIQHPITTEVPKCQDQIRETFEAIVKLKHQSIVIYPNADAGGRSIIQTIKEYEDHSFIDSYRNLPRKDYLSIMNIASVMVGNSSSGIIEAPSLHVPVVNIGSRQDGRERAENVIDVSYDRIEIEKAINKAIHNKKFREKVKKCKNPYGEGKASQKMVRILKNLEIDEDLLQKESTYE